jgi:hypothetical protein
MKSKIIRISGIKNLLDNAVQSSGFEVPMCDGSEIENTFFTKSVKNGKLYLGFKVTNTEGKAVEFTANGGDFREWCGEHYDKICKFISDDELDMQSLSRYVFTNDGKEPFLLPIVPKTEAKPEDKPDPSKMTVAELKTWLTEQGVEFPKSAKLADLRELALQPA